MIAEQTYILLSIRVTNAPSAARNSFSIGIFFWGGGLLPQHKLVC